MFFKEKKIEDDKKNYLYDKLFVSNRNFTTKNVKIVKNSRFFERFLFKIQGFSSFFFG